MKNSYRFPTPIPLLALFLSAFTMPAHAAQTVSDAQIAAIVVTANQVDIDAGKFAAEKSTNPEVKAFANTMVRDHTAVNQSAVDLVTKLKVSPEENDTSRSLKAGGDTNIAALRKLDGMRLDKAYVDHEVAYHEQVIQALDTVLIPNAHNAELKALLVKVRPAFVEHLNHAKHLQTQIK
jgi:putative membrane protein